MYIIIEYDSSLFLLRCYIFEMLCECSRRISAVHMFRNRCKPFRNMHTHTHARTQTHQPPPPPPPATTNNSTNKKARVYPKLVFLFVFLGVSIVNVMQSFSAYCRFFGRIQSQYDEWPADRKREKNSTKKQNRRTQNEVDIDKFTLPIYQSAAHFISRLLLASQQQQQQQRQRGTKCALGTLAYECTTLSIIFHYCIDCNGMLHFVLEAADSIWFAISPIPHNWSSNYGSKLTVAMDVWSQSVWWWLM